MNFSFRDFIEQAHSHEIELLNTIPHMDMLAQAQEDIDIHKRAVSKGTFDAYGSKFLINDMGIKERFKELVKKSHAGERIDDKDKQEMIMALTKDQQGHRDYIDRQEFGPDTGSDEWHQMWIGVYDKWISWLNSLGTNY
jgi:hypothetical protein